MITDGGIGILGTIREVHQVAVGIVVGTSVRVRHQILRVSEFGRPPGIRSSGEERLPVPGPPGRVRPGCGLHTSASGVACKTSYWWPSPTMIRSTESQGSRQTAL
jgi:hypothetical protein